MASVIGQFYGPTIARRFEELFRAHLVIAAQLVQTPKAGNKQAVINARRRWFENVKEIASFLSCSL